MSRRGWTAVVLGVVAVFIVLLLGVGVIAALTLGRITGDDWQEHVLQGEGMKKVAVIRVAGEIHGGGSTPSVFGDGGAGADDITDQLRQALEDDDVAAAIVRIDSPGGAVVASDEIGRAVRRLRDEKPVFASMGDIAASGGYYIASQAQRIFANRGTITGSIGVIAVLFNLEGTAAKLGAKPIVLKSGALKGAGSPFDELRDDERAVYQGLLDQAHDQFIDAVANGRKMSERKLRRLADGRPYSGEDAQKNGLVDELGDLNDAYDAVLEAARLDRDDARLVEYRSRRGFSLLPFGMGSPVDEVKRELGLDPGLKYLYLP